MKKHLLTILSAAVISSIAAFAQCYPEGKTAEDMIREDLELAGNNHLNYRYTDLSDTKAPWGYRPFYISHYGRHGSRSDWQGEAWYRVEETLAAAQAQGILSEQGEKALECVRLMCERSEGMREMLTPTGAREHAGIAERMYKRFPRVFRGRRTVDAKSSTVQRCIVSMGSFTTSLAARNPKLKFDILTGQTYMDYIAHTSGYKTATKGASKMLSNYKKSLPRDTTAFFAVMFSDTTAARELITDAYHFESDMLQSATYCGCFDVENELYKCLPFQVVYDYWSIKNHSLYLEHNNSAEFGDRRMPISRRLVNDIITKADAAVAGSDRAADLRFGHDYPLMALSGYLDLEGVGGRYAFDEIDANWFGSIYICMASNLQIVFYRNRRNDVLVKCLWNEKEVGINGLEPVKGPYYRWSDVRDYWTNRFPEDQFPEIDGSQEGAAPGMPTK